MFLPWPGPSSGALGEAPEGPGLRRALLPRPEGSPEEEMKKGEE